MAEKSLNKGWESLEDSFQHSHQWRERHSTIFDPNKTTAMVFTKKKVDRPLVQLGDQMLPLAKKELTQDHIAANGHPEAVALFLANQAALMGAALPKEILGAQNLQLKLYTTLQRWAEHFPVCLYRCPGHQHNISRLTNNPLTPEEATQIGFKALPKLIIKALDLLEKGPAATIHQLQTGHVPLNNYLHRIKRTNPPLCQHCNKQETPIHYLVKFPNFKNQQKQFIKEVTRNQLKLNPKSLKSILDSPLSYPLLAQYITETKKFQ
ncbi:hypothetical protein O181_008971 [Austropuccinia psidii MF-1]|uniref:RNase H type-1 domain-containing protein n=1 Tax=Austropuccinia psidii MF-1 TaxID=1389203 RepID=A0A9Q3GJ14_9BASI|nr:hypothetical protein [Austropuccinia psidii MF-1]